jgi:Ras-related protein Rab-7A
LEFTKFQAGQERFFSLGGAFYRGVDACVLVFDVTNPKSFENVANWKKELISKIGCNESKAPPFAVVGNKVDLSEQRLVPQEMATAWCSSQGNLPYFETSAKDAINVEQAFKHISKRALENAPTETNLLEDTIVLSDAQVKEQRGGKYSCC